MLRRTTPATLTDPTHFHAKHFAGRGTAVLLLVWAMTAGNVHAQEIPRPSSARQVEKTALPTQANFKVGEVLLRVDASMAVEFVDNVDLTKNGRADMVITPSVGINATWAVTKLNTLQFRAGLGYSYYVNSPNLNRQTTTITPDSALSFNVYAGDVKINFHDQFSLQQEVTSQGTLSGVAQLERFTNTLGFNVLWDTNDIIWHFGYDHFNFITLSGANSSNGSSVAGLGRLNHSTDQFSASMAAKVNSVLLAGFEATGSYSDYPEQSGSNYTSITAGPYFELQVTKYTHAFLSGGFKGYYSGTNAPGSVSVNNSTVAQPAQGDPTGYYANLSLVHRLNRNYSDRLDIGHADDVEGLGGHTQINSIRYNGAWQVNTTLSLALGLFYEDAAVVSGSALAGAVASDYTRFGANLSTGFRVTQHLGLSVGYQYVNKNAVRESESYSQNRVTFTLGYRF